MKPQMDRAKHLEALIESWFPGLKPEESKTASGRQFLAVVSARANKRWLKDTEALYRKLGHAAFIERCSFGLGLIDEILKAEEIPDFIATARTGNRSVKTYTA
jgi:hypothetical protein